MNSDTLRKYQAEAVGQIVRAVSEEKRRRALVSMPTGTGAARVLTEAALLIRRQSPSGAGIILFAAAHAEIKEQFDRLAEKACKSESPAETPYRAVTCDRLERYLKDASERIFMIVFDSAENTCGLPESLLSGRGDLILLAAANRPVPENSWFFNVPPVFSYAVRDAVYDGVLPSYEHPHMREAAFAGWCGRLLSRYGMKPAEPERGGAAALPDMVLRDGDRLVMAELKLYSGRSVSPARFDAAARRLGAAAEGANAVGLMMLLGELDRNAAAVFREKYGIYVWDVANLLFLTEALPEFRNSLEEISLFSLAGVSASKPLFWKEESPPAQASCRAPENKASALKQRLTRCPAGTENSTQYEEICLDIVKYLFSASFTRILKQLETRDGLFRFDTICSVKDNGGFWGLLQRHFNSHFIIFEYKNSSKPLQQNAVYTTEKYLFRAVSRNAAVLISRKGFSKNAQFAADGCLKEHGKLLLSINDDELLKMIDLRDSGEDPADFLLEKLEDILMTTGK